MCLLVKENDILNVLVLSFDWDIKFLMGLIRKDFRNKNIYTSIFDDSIISVKKLDESIKGYYNNLNDFIYRY